MDDAPSFDELGHAGPEHLDPAYVAGYDRKAQVNVADDVALLRERGMDGTSVLVDIGAGTGVLALAAARFCRRVVAVDVSPAMLKVLREKLAASDLANVECVEAGFLTYETPGNTVDFVYSRNALHHLPDFWKAVALDRIAKMLRPRGYLRLRDLVYSFVPTHANEVLAAWLEQAPRDPAEGFTREDLETHIRTEFSTFSWVLEPMLQAVGFAVEDVVHAHSQVFSAYLCRKQ